VVSVSNGSPKAQGLVEFQEFTGKQKPNIVTFSALLWDIARVFELAPMALFNEQLDKLFVAEWMQHTDFWLGMLEVGPATASLSVDGLARQFGHVRCVKASSIHT
jgi:hypothetical protein